MRTGTLLILAALCCLPLLTAAATSQAEPPARMWDVVRSPRWDLTVRSIERRRDPLTGPDGALVRPAGSFAILVIDLTNRSDRALAPSHADFVLRTVDGVRLRDLSTTPAAEIHAVTAGHTPFGGAVSPGDTVTTVLLFDIDADAGRLTLEFLPAGQPIHIDECKCNLPSPVRTVTSG